MEINEQDLFSVTSRERKKEREMYFRNEEVVCIVPTFRSFGT